MARAETAARLRMIFFICELQDACCALDPLSALRSVVFLNGTDRLCSPNRKGEGLEALAPFRPFLLLVRGGWGRTGVRFAASGREGQVLILAVAGRCREGDAVAVGAD